MVQSWMPSSASNPAQECHWSVLSAGTIGPASWALSVAGPEGVLLAEPGVEPDEVQAVTASRAAAPMVSATALTPRPRAVRPPGRGIDIPP